ncbi:MAG: ABC transporter ATP-binding protein [Planctomycetota bacterium]|nr:ABC transporter ATP-binding protein [Planctomycetota bacterium]
MPTPAEQPLLRIENLAVSFGGDRGRVLAVNRVNFSVYPRQTLAVVGESGCGKSVTALSTLRLVPTPPGRFDGGRILWSGGKGEKTGPASDSNTTPVNLLTLPDRDMRSIRGNQIAMIFQEPMTSLNPVYTIGEQILEAILLHQKVDRRQAVEIATAALAEVGIADPGPRLKEYPHRLSGGMRQRVMIAMALACQPRLLLADEPTTALDVTIQAQILELLRRLQEQRGMSVLLITHDLGVVAENADTVAVMYAGRVVEFGSVVDVFREPLHPYTKGLFASMPVLGDERKRLATIPGNVPNPARLPKGCPFNPRCAEMNNDAKCGSDDPPLLEVREKHWAACWHTPGYAQGKATVPDLAFRRETAKV